MLAPAAPHITEELWSRRLAAAGAAVGVDPQRRPGPRSTRAAVVEATREIPVQVNGKLRDKVTVPTDATTADIEAAVLGTRADPDDPRRPDAGPDRRGRRRQAGQPRHPVSTVTPSGRARLRSAPGRDRTRRRRRRPSASRDRARRISRGHRDVRPRGRAAGVRHRRLDARLLLRDHPAHGARQPAARRRRRPAEPGRPHRGHRQARSATQGPLGRGRRAPWVRAAIAAQVAYRRA